MVGYHCGCVYGSCPSHFHIYCRVKRGVVGCEGSSSKEFPPNDFEHNQPHSSLSFYFLICFPNINFWKMDMNMILAYPPWTYLLLYLCYGHLANTHFMDFHQRSQFQPRILCLPVPIYLMHFSVIWRTNSPDFFLEGEWSQPTVEDGKKGELNIPKLMIGFHSNEGSGLRRLWNRVYWKWYTTFLAISCEAFISPSNQSLMSWIKGRF